MSADRLYTPRVLELATSLANWPLDDALPLRGSARSTSCGSTLELGLALDGEGRVARLGLTTHACAIGQAAAAIFAGGAAGRSGDDIAGAESALAGWLAGTHDLPDWPGIADIAAVREYPARHGAVMLAWRAVRAVLSSGNAAG